MQTTISQYANSATIMSLLSSLNAETDPSGDIDLIYTNMRDIATASGYGLDVWGRTVGASRTLQFPIIAVSGQFLGFSESNSTDRTPFGQAPFYLSPSSSQNLTLTDIAYRALILTKALFNISGSSALEINAIMMSLFAGRGNCYILDLGDMHARLAFEFNLSASELAILKYSGVFAGPTGVALEIVMVQVGSAFGFAEAGAKVEGFDNGIYFGGIL
jgi:hypothetical protein